MNEAVEEAAAVGEKEGHGTDQAEEETNEDDTTQEGPDELGEEL